VREPTTRHAAYLRDVFEETTAVVERIAKRLEGKDYDTIVGTGISGALLLLMLRDRLKKHVAIVRKPHDGSHSYNWVEGTLGARYVIVDDQVASGATVNRIVNTIRRQLIDKEALPLRACPTFVGVCSYVDNSEIEPWLPATETRFDESRMEVPPTRTYMPEAPRFPEGMGMTATELELLSRPATYPMPQAEADKLNARYFTSDVQWVLVDDQTPTTSHKAPSPEEPELHD
jgi:hypothetical protein